MTDPKDPTDGAGVDAGGVRVLVDEAPSERPGAREAHRWVTELLSALQSYGYVLALGLDDRTEQLFLCDDRSGARHSLPVEAWCLPAGVAARIVVRDLDRERASQISEKVTLPGSDPLAPLPDTGPDYMRERGR